MSAAYESKRANCQDEQIRVRQLIRHEEKVRDLERARMKRNIQALLTVVDPQPCDFEGCVE